MALGAAPPAGAVLSLSVVSPVALSNFGQGQTATGSGAITVTNGTGSNWTLQAQDEGSGAGRMTAAPAGCTGSDAMLQNPLQVAISTGATGVSPAGTLTLSGSPQTVATATGQAPLAVASLSAAYTQVIPRSEALLGGCVYGLTVTYTLQ
jgi:hypothetical protein